jgi:large-conductance mechanosensitive channel
MGGFFGEFWRFLEGRRASTLFIGFVLAMAYLRLVQAVVEHLVMPFFGLFSDGDWRVLTWRLGDIRLEVGPFIAEVLVFFGVAWGVIWLAMLSRGTRAKTEGTDKRP